MPKESVKPVNLKRKITRLADGLRDRFGMPSRPRRANILDALVETLLSQGTTDHNRDLAFGELKRQFPGWEAAANATERALARAVKSAGLGNQKAARIHSFLQWLRSETGALSLEFLHEKADDEAVALLTQHKGIGVKTAYVTLMWASSRDLFAVDVHIHRIAGRLGLIGGKTGPEKAHGELGPHVPEGRAFELHMNMLAFGRTICTARNPKCGECGFRRMCPYLKSLNEGDASLKGGGAKPPAARTTARKTKHPSRNRRPSSKKPGIN